jgi:hypothetical protein
VYTTILGSYYHAVDVFITAPISLRQAVPLGAFLTNLLGFSAVEIKGAGGNIF